MVFKPSGRGRSSADMTGSIFAREVVPFSKINEKGLNGFSLNFQEVVITGQGRAKLGDVLDYWPFISENIKADGLIRQPTVLHHIVSLLSTVSIYCRFRAKWYTCNTNFLPAIISKLEQRTWRVNSATLQGLYTSLPLLLPAAAWAEVRFLKIVYWQFTWANSPVVFQFGTS